MPVIPLVVGGLIAVVGNEFDDKFIDPLTGDNKTVISAGGIALVVGGVALAVYLKRKRVI